MHVRKFSVSDVARVVLGISLATFAVDAMAVDEIIVTTRKREENLQKVPIAVQAITADEIERKGITSLGALVQQSPSVILDQGFAPQDQRITIRGLSPTRGRQNVAVLQDGIEVGSEAIATAGGSLLINPRLFDLERVEIVKGPQIAKPRSMLMP
jgi:outer membrane receptor protein involved in Fe transport